MDFEVDFFVHIRDTTPVFIGYRRRVHPPACPCVYNDARTPEVQLIASEMYRSTFSLSIYIVKRTHRPIHFNIGR